MTKMTTEVIWKELNCPMINGLCERSSCMGATCGGGSSYKFYDKEWEKTTTYTQKVQRWRDKKGFWGGREKYIDDIFNLLNAEGKYLSNSFNIDTPERGGRPGESIRKGINMLTLYTSTLRELEELFSSRFNILDSRKVNNIRYDGSLVISNFLFMEKK